MRQEQEDAKAEVTEVAPGILRAQIPIHFTGLGHVNTYLLEDAEGWTAIDPGLPGPATWKALKDRLRQVGAKVKDVHTVVVTHSHPDHFGSAEKLRREADASMVAATDFRTFFDLLEPDLVESPEARKPGDDAAALERLRDRFDMKTPWGGEMPRPPMPDGVLLSGDHVLPTITPHISGLGSVSDDPLADFVGSLDKVALLEGVGTCLPAHGHPFTNLQERVDDIKEHHVERLEKLSEISHAEGEADVETLMRGLFSERAWGNMAEAETYAHLEHLRIAGKAESRWQDGLLFYTVD